ncbi:MAG TPA: hypothetical protein VMA35_00470 [Candidatus Sulfopaludibacter sp.]|nr:hypothetical protein [Candidatus Sulfopaludibacter sp.]
MASAPLHAQSATITNQPASQVVWAGCNATFVVGVSNGASFTYEWQLNSTNLPNGIITTVAGGGSGGDGGGATSANLSGVDGAVALDASGDLFIPDSMSNRIRKVNTSGIITTVAGNGNYGFSGDGGPATNAALFIPTGVALDASGDLFISDNGNNRIREVDTNGIITTVAGGGNGYGPATNHSLLCPEGLTTDASGNCFFADEGDSVIYKLSTNGFLTVVVGGGPGGFSGDGGPAIYASIYYPFDVVFDTSGNLFIADTENSRVREVNTNGIITTVAGNGVWAYTGDEGDGGPATNASFYLPTSVALDDSGNLFIVDGDRNRIRMVNTNGIITTVAGTGYAGYFGDGGPATNALLYTPTGVVVDTSGNLFISDGNNCCIRKVTNTQGPSLALNNVSPANAGNYQAVVTDSSGSVTSSIASLVVTASPLIYQAAQNIDGSVTLNCVSQPGSTNTVLCATNLSPPVSWVPISTNLAGASGQWQFTDTNTAGCLVRFYRSQMQ